MLQVPKYTSEARLRPCVRRPANRPFAELLAGESVYLLKRINVRSFVRLFPFALLALAPLQAPACTAFCAAVEGRVLVGNNEDLLDPSTRLWFIPPEKGAHGRLYVGYEFAWPQGGMNDHGLFWDGFGVPPTQIPALGKPPLAPHPGAIPNTPYPGAALDRILADCATVEEVIRLFQKYQFPWTERAVLMVADASGDAAIFDGNEILRKHGRYLVQTNFRQTLAKPGEAPCGRFKIATAMLDAAGERISVDLFRTILAATHQEGGSPTQYSNIYDLKRRVMHLYHFHNYSNVVVIDLARELAKGQHSVAIASLFPRTFAYEESAAQNKDFLKRIFEGH